MRILVLNGPNLNLLGEREPEKYGYTTLKDLASDLRLHFPDVTFSFFQSNHEGALIDRLHQAHRDHMDGIVFNPGAYTHTSIALRDAIAAIRPPVIEVHISNVHARESFRHTSMLAPVCVGQLAGFGVLGYRMATQYLIWEKGTERE